ncbi:hypothetical protein [Limnobacter sp.]|uniref:hypothetical protein n=1 Tax=Limnobacter sp. TaxID=2003368 RepID=UPI003515F39A
MSYLALLIAAVIETLLPEGAFDGTRRSLARFNQELEIDLAALGAPSFAHLQWWIPVLLWLLGAYFLHQLLWSTWPALGGAFSVLVLLYGLRFRQLNDVLTNIQLYLNQGDFYRARERVSLWLKEYDGSEVHIHRPEELVYHTVAHGVERALRQYFALVFWFLMVPGPSGLVFYLMVHWSVVREREMWESQAFPHERATMSEDWQESKARALCSARFVLFALEWLPARLLALTIGLLSQLDDAALAWRQAKINSRFSNRAPLTAVCFGAVGLGSGQGHANDTNDEPMELPVQVLQSFRQLMFKCAMLWLLVGLVLALLGWMPAAPL